MSVQVQFDPVYTKPLNFKCTHDKYFAECRTCTTSFRSIAGAYFKGSSPTYNALARKIEERVNAGCPATRILVTYLALITIGMDCAKDIMYGRIGIHGIPIYTLLKVKKDKYCIPLLTTNEIRIKKDQLMSRFNELNAEVKSKLDTIGIVAYDDDEGEYFLTDALDDACNAVGNVTIKNMIFSQVYYYDDAKLDCTVYMRTKPEPTFEYHTEYDANPLLNYELDIAADTIGTVDRNLIERSKKAMHAKQDKHIPNAPTVTGITNGFAKLSAVNLPSVPSRLVNTKKPDKEEDVVDMEFSSGDESLFDSEFDDDDDESINDSDDEAPMKQPTEEEDGIVEEL